MMPKLKEFVILLNFLKTGFSTRKLDKLLGFSNTKGWKSWEILKKYKLNADDKGKLFLYSEQQSREIIGLLALNPQKNYIDILIQKNAPKNLQKYKNTFVLADSEKQFYNIFSGETRNIIRDFFNPKKKLIGKCQYTNCVSAGEIDTVHYIEDRPLLFMQSASKFKTRYTDNLFKYDVYNTMKDFLKSHAKDKSVCFLCKNHHNELHKLEKTNKSHLRVFKKHISF